MPDARAAPAAAERASLPSATLGYACSLDLVLHHSTPYSLLSLVVAQIVEMQARLALTPIMVINDHIDYKHVLRHARTHARDARDAKQGKQGEETPLMAMVADVNAVDDVRGCLGPRTHMTFARCLTLLISSIQGQHGMSFFAYLALQYMILCFNHVTIVCPYYRQAMASEGVCFM